MKTLEDLRARELVRFAIVDAIYDKKIFIKSLAGVSYVELSKQPKKDLKFLEGFLKELDSLKLTAELISDNIKENTDGK